MLLACRLKQSLRDPHWLVKPLFQVYPMFGEAEFGAGDAGHEGLGALWEAADSLRERSGTQSDLQEATHSPAEGTAPVLHGTAEVVGNSNTGDWPAPSLLDQKRLAHARAITPSNLPASMSLSGFKPSVEKPRQCELWQALMERKPACRPKNWKVDKIVGLLCETAPCAELASAMGQADGATATPTAAVASAATALIPLSAAPASDEETKKLRWSRDKLARLIMIIAELSHEFIKRDRRLDRQEMDAKGMDAFWEHAATLFNSATAFDLPKSTGVHKYKNLSAGPTPYVAEAAKLKKEFGDLRSSLTKCLINFRKSGMGDDPSAEKVAEAADAVYSSSFSDFTGGDELLDLAYEVFSTKDILDSATCNMPEGTEFTTTSTRRVADQPKPKHSAGGKKRKGEVDVEMLKKVLRSMPPVKMHQSKAEKLAAKAHSIRETLKAIAGLEKMIKLQKSKLVKAEAALTLAFEETTTEVDSEGTEDFSAKRYSLAKKKVSEIKKVLRLLEMQLAELHTGMGSVDDMESEGEGGNASDGLASDEDADEDIDDDDEESL